jgi:hypothetical protein
MKKSKNNLSSLVDLDGETIDIINNIANRLASRFKFGYHDLSDMKQQARLFALEGLKNYDGVRPLENFLWTHVRNRLFNFKRDKYARPSKPCLDCKYYIVDSDNDCIKHNDITECKTYAKWVKLNTQKKNIMNFIDITGINDEHEKTMSSVEDLDNYLDYKEILTIINKNLPIALRPLFKKLQFGTKLNKSQKNKIQTILREILLSNGYNHTEETRITE